MSVEALFELQRQQAGIKLFLFEQPDLKRGTMWSKLVALPLQ